MELQHQANVFRMSATLFANNNYQISPVQLHKKVVEDALFVLNKDEGVTLSALAVFIEKEYFFDFDESELRRVLHNSRFNNAFEWHSSVGAENRYNLKKERREQLEKSTTKTLNEFIEEYLETHNLAAEKSESIYQYLYGVFTTNVDTFKRLLEANSIKFLTEYHTPDEQDVDLINGFLDWDNEQKNIAIFNLASYALEFCLLTSKKGSNLKLESLKHKTFYLDTNILYRVIGINGEDRRLRSLSFLRKLKESDDQICISKVTWDEFEGSLRNYIKRLRKSETPAIRSKVYTEYITYDDVFRYYHLWATKHKNATVDLFVDWMNASMKALIEDFDIEIVNSSPYSPEVLKDQLHDMAAQIMGFGKGKLFDTAMNDACNIAWVEHSRNSGEKTLFSTKTFLVSSDYGLYVWDAKYHSKATPIVVMPSQWLSLLLRYVSRSNDDFRSFVCFLNIQNKEGVLSSDQINAILAGIAEMTDSVEQQRFLLETIIEREFKDGAGGKTNDQLKAIARHESERLLQSQVDDMRVAHQCLEKSFNEMKRQFDKHKEDTEEQLRTKENQLSEANAQIDQLKSNVQGLSNDLEKNRAKALEAENKKDEDIKRLKKDLHFAKGLNEFNGKKSRRILWKGIGIVLTVAFVIWFFCSSVSSKTLMGGFLAWIESLSNTQQYVARIGLGLVLSSILIPLVVSFYKDCISEYKEDQEHLNQ